jgi:hypothetical protein
MKSVAPMPMPPNSGRSAMRMMRWWADEFDRLREQGRAIKMLAKGALKGGCSLKSHVH